MGSKSSGGDVDYPPFAPGGQYPSNADIPTLGVGVNPDGGPDWQPARVRNVDFGNSPAPKGRFILDALTLDREAASGIIGIEPENTSQNPEALAFFAGRVWYGGFSEHLAENVLFSQVLEDEEELLMEETDFPPYGELSGTNYSSPLYYSSTAGKCYQRQDPTVEDLNDLLDSDGGNVVLPGAGLIKYMAPIGPSLVVLGTGGVWEISGGFEGFKATSYTVNKISEVGIYSPTSCVEVEGAVLFWGEEDIFAVQADQNGVLSVSSISANIKTFYNSISYSSRYLSRGYYDKQDQIVYWLYYESNDAEHGFEFHPYAYNQALVFDVSFSAFYRWDLSSSIESNHIGVPGSPYFEDNHISVLAKVDQYTPDAGIAVSVFEEDEESFYYVKSSEGVYSLEKRSYPYFNLVASKVMDTGSSSTIAFRDIFYDSSYLYIYGLRPTEDEFICIKANKSNLAIVSIQSKSEGPLDDFRFSSHVGSRLGTNVVSTDSVFDGGNSPTRNKQYRVTQLGQAAETIQHEALDGGILPSPSGAWNDLYSDVSNNGTVFQSYATYTDSGNDKVALVKHEFDSSSFSNSLLSSDLSSELGVTFERVSLVRCLPLGGGATRIFIDHRSPNGFVSFDYDGTFSNVKSHNSFPTFLGEELTDSYMSKPSLGDAKIYSVADNEFTDFVTSGGSFLHKTTTPYAVYVYPNSAISELGVPLFAAFFTLGTDVYSLLENIHNEYHTELVLRGIYRPPSTATEPVQIVLTAQGEHVTVSGADVTVLSARGVSVEPSISFLASIIYNTDYPDYAGKVFPASLDENKYQDFIDWSPALFGQISEDFKGLYNVPKSGEVVVGWDTSQDFMRYKQVPYLYTYTEVPAFKQRSNLLVEDDPNNEGMKQIVLKPDGLRPSVGLNAEVLWDWSISDKGRRQSRKQKAYKHPKIALDSTDTIVVQDNTSPAFIDAFFSTLTLNDLYYTDALHAQVGVPVPEAEPYSEVSVTKLKARGKGRSMSIRYTSNPGDTFTLLGYAMPITASENT